MGITRKEKGNRKEGSILKINRFPIMKEAFEKARRNNGKKQYVPNAKMENRSLRKIEEIRNSNRQSPVRT